MKLEFNRLRNIIAHLSIAREICVKQICNIIAIIALDNSINVLDDRIVLNDRWFYKGMDNML